MSLFPAQVHLQDIVVITQHYATVLLLQCFDTIGWVTEMNHHTVKKILHQQSQKLLLWKTNGRPSPTWHHLQKKADMQ